MTVGTDVVTMNATGRELWLDGYEWGFQHGIDRGRGLADEEHRGTWSVSAAIARQAAAAGSWADLAERRGEPGAAEAHRALLRDRGIA